MEILLEVQPKKTYQKRVNQIIRISDATSYAKLKYLAGKEIFIMCQSCDWGEWMNDWKLMSNVVGWNILKWWRCIIMC